MHTPAVWHNRATVWAEEREAFLAAQHESARQRADAETAEGSDKRYCVLLYVYYARCTTTGLLSYIDTT